MLKIEQLSISYEQKEVVHNFSFEVEQGEILSIIGPNGSGKSTILKAIARMQPYSAGNIFFEGENMRRLSSKEIARKMCMLSQQNQAPSDISVKSLVAYGRYPHKKWFERLNAEEPTTFLDIAHQHEVLELVRELNRDMGMTVVMVLHDLNQASSYSDKIVVVKDGNRAQIGTPDEVMTEQMIQQIYRMEAEIQYVSWDNAPRIQLKNTVRV